MPHNNDSFLDKALDFQFSLDNLLLGDNKIRHHVIVNFPEEQEFLFQVANGQDLDQNNIDDDLHNEKA